MQSILKFCVLFGQPRTTRGPLPGRSINGNTSYHIQLSKSKSTNQVTAIAASSATGTTNLCNTGTSCRLTMEFHISRNLNETFVTKPFYSGSNDSPKRFNVWISFFGGCLCWTSWHRKKVASQTLSRLWRYTVVTHGTLLIYNDDNRNFVV